MSTHSVDVCIDADVVSAVAAAVRVHGPLHAVVACAGLSTPRTLLDSDAAEFEAILRVNLVGCRNIAAAVVPHMPPPGRDGGGTLVFVSSQAAQVGLYGYTAYSASKFGLRGLAEALSMELAPRGVRVSLSFPPDCDTPMHAEEAKTKPVETALLSEASAMVSPSVVATSIVNGLEVWAFSLPVGFDGWMLATLTSGMAPPASLWEAVVQVATMGLWRAVGLCYVLYFYFVVKRAAAARGAGGEAAPVVAGREGGGGRGRSKPRGRKE